MSRGVNGEYLVEMHGIGNSVKVTAVCPVTGMESIVGPTNAGKEMLSRNAVRKLEYAMNKQVKNPNSGGIIA